MKKRSVSIRGHRTSLSLEDPFWDELLLLANESGTSVAGLITEIDKNRQAGLSSAVRIFVLQTLKQKAAACRTVSVEITSYLHRNHYRTPQRWESENRLALSR